MTQRTIQSTHHRTFLAVLLWSLISLCVTPPMSASDSNLHSLAKQIDQAEIQVTLRNAAAPGESFAVECIYRPYRNWDVKKSRHFALFSGWIGGPSREWIKVHRTEFHSVRQEYRAADRDISFKVSLRDPQKEFSAYQLQTIRVVGSITGTFEWDRWFSAPPRLGPGFELNCTATHLRGNLRLPGLAAAPLRGALPLWPTLRTIQLDFTPIHVPTLRIFEATQKHRWDGWHQTIPQFWKGGRTITAYHTNSPTVWSEHEYDIFPPTRQPSASTPESPSPNSSFPGILLEIFWPEGPSLAFPEATSQSDIYMLALPLSKVPTRMKELIGKSVQLRPGWEARSLSAQEWNEMDEAVPTLDPPFSLEWDKTLQIIRKAPITEPWLVTFGSPYDTDRRYIIASLLLRPDRWTGPLPE